MLFKESLAVELKLGKLPTCVQNKIRQHISSIDINKLYKATVEEFRNVIGNAAQEYPNILHTICTGFTDYPKYISSLFNANISNTPNCQLIFGVSDAGIPVGLPMKAIEDKIVVANNIKSHIIDTFFPKIKIKLDRVESDADKVSEEFLSQFADDIKVSITEVDINTSEIMFQEYSNSFIARCKKIAILSKTEDLKKYIASSKTPEIDSYLYNTIKKELIKYEGVPLEENELKMNIEHTLNIFYKILQNNDNQNSSYGLFDRFIDNTTYSMASLEKYKVLKRRQWCSFLLNFIISDLITKDIFFKEKYMEYSSQRNEYLQILNTVQNSRNDLNMFINLDNKLGVKLPIKKHRCRFKRRRLSRDNINSLPVYVIPNYQDSIRCIVTIDIPNKKSYSHEAKLYYDNLYYQRGDSGEGPYSMLE